MADNQNYWIKVAKNKIRDIYYRMQYIGNQPLEAGGAECIKKMLSSSQPFMICRIGAEESRTAIRWMKNIPYEERNIHNIMYNAGVFPNDKNSVDNF